MTTASREVLSSIQVLRGIAALMVALFHVPFYLGSTETLSILRGGVDLFFVISGFVMMVSTLDKREDVAGFVRRRLLRVVPLYWLATLAFAFVWIVLDVRDVHLDDVIRSLLFVPYLDEFSGLVQPVLGVGWALNLELCFYALFALSMFLRPWQQVFALTSAFVALVVVRVLMDPSEDTVLFFYTTPILLEFAGGMALGLLVPRLRMLPTVAGLALVIISAAVAIVLDVLLPLPRVVGLGIPSLAIVAGLVVLEPYFRSRRLAALHVLGEASYSLYLVHLIVMVALQPVVANWPPLLGGATMIGLCLVAAVATYRFVERPILGWARGPARVRATA